MTFGRPQGLWLLTLLIPLIVLYILKVRRTRAQVGSTWLWRAAERELLARAPFRRFVPQISLLLQALTILLASAIFAELSLETERPSGRHVAVVIDVSASMSAMTGAPPGETRLEVAKKQAAARVLSLAPDASVMVIAAGRDAEQVFALGRDKRRAASAIEALEATDAEGKMEPATLLAFDRLGETTAPELWVFSDGYLAHDFGPARSEVRSEVILVGDEVPNSAITRASVRLGKKPKSATDEAQVFSVLRHFGPTSREVYVTLRRRQSSASLDSRRLTLDPNVNVPVVLSFAPTPEDFGDALVIEISPPDALAVDDVAFVRVPPSPRLVTVLATASSDVESPWLERVLSSDDDIELRKATASSLTAAAPDAALIVADGFCPEASLPGGDVLIWNPPPGPCFGVTVGSTVSRPAVTSWEPSDPRLRFLTLDDLTVLSSRSLSPGGSKGALVRAGADVLIADATGEARSVTLVGFDLAESDWPLKASFVLFMRNVAEHARARRAKGSEIAVVLGEPLRMAAPIGATTAVIARDDRPLQSVLQDGVLVSPPLTKAGLYEATFDGARHEWVPVNLTSARESNLAERSEFPEAKGLTVSVAGDRPLVMDELAWLLAPLALILVLLELLHYSRGASFKQPATISSAKEKRA